MWPFAHRRRVPDLRPETRFRISPDIATAISGDEVVICDFGIGKYFVLNNVAGSVWRLVVRGASCIEIADSLRREFPEAPTSVERDTSSILQRFVDQRLINPCPL